MDSFKIFLQTAGKSNNNSVLSNAFETHTVKHTHSVHQSKSMQAFIAYILILGLFPGRSKLHVLANRILFFSL